MKNHIIIAGIPGTGKTTTGNYLSKHFGFAHYDFENETTFALYTKDKRSFLTHAKKQPKVVITWGFVPTKHIRHILTMRKRGFLLVWFDGDRIAAFRSFLKRGDVTDEQFYQQMIDIYKRNVLARLTPKVVNSFTPDGSFRPLEELCKELIEYSFHMD